MPSNLIAYLLALVSLAVPLAAGWAGGRFASRRGWLASRWWTPALLLGPPALAALLPPYLFGMGFWDLLVTAGLLGAGLRLGLRHGRSDRRNLLTGTAGTLVALVILETGVRLLLPEPPAFPPPLDARMFWPLPPAYPTYLDWYHQGLHPDLYPDLFFSRTQGADRAARHVLHVGDSMVFGDQVGIGNTFPALLERMDPGTAHTNAGIPAVGPDYHALLIRRWTRRIDVHLVVLHLYSGNDLVEMDQPFSCCRDGPLLRYESGRPAPLCEEPEWGDSRARPRLSSPPPYFLRVATGFSRLARHLCGLFHRIRPMDEQVDPVAWQHLEAVLRWTRDDLERQGIPLIVSLLPHRQDLTESGQGSLPAGHIHLRMKQLCTGLGLEVLDGWEPLAEAFRHSGIDRWFLADPPGNIHLSKEGHQLMARWLATRIPAPRPPAPAGGDGEVR